MSIRFSTKVRDFSDLTISDTHIGAPYANYGLYLPPLVGDIGQLSNTQAKQKRFIFNGDIFDFYDGHNGKIILPACISIVEKLVKGYPDIQFKYILGNHDNILELANGLKQLERYLPNFTFHDDYYIHHNTILYTHGDLPIGSYGPKWMRDPVLIPLSTTREGLISLDDIDKHYSKLELSYKNVAKSFLTGPLSYVTFPLSKAIPDFKSQFDQYPNSTEIKYAIFGHVHSPSQLSDKVHIFNIDGKDYAVSFRNTGASVNWIPHRAHVIEGNYNGRGIEVINEGVTTLKQNTFISKDVHAQEVYKSIVPELRHIHNHTPTTLMQLGSTVKLLYDKITGRAA